MKILVLGKLLALIFLVHESVYAQENRLSENYLGLLPAFLVEPYDTINALEVNLIPILYEIRVGERNDIGLQIRPVANYRFYKPEPGFSQLGGTVVANKYFLDWFDAGFWLVPQLGGYVAYTYNRLDKIRTMTMGLEPGILMKVNDKISTSISLQPGINYYLNEFSRDFVKTESGFKFHFGVFFHVGYNF